MKLVSMPLDVLLCEIVTVRVYAAAQMVADTKGQFHAADVFNNLGDWWKEYDYAMLKVKLESLESKGLVRQVKLGIYQIADRIPVAKKPKPAKKIAIEEKTESFVYWCLSLIAKKHPGAVKSITAQQTKKTFEMFQRAINSGKINYDGLVKATQFAVNHEEQDFSWSSVFMSPRYLLKKNKQGQMYYHVFLSLAEQNGEESTPEYLQDA